MKGWVFCGLMLVLSSEAWGAVRAELVFPGPRQGRTWELLRVECDDALPAERVAVSVQDARGNGGAAGAGGGLVVTRVLAVGGTGGREGREAIDALFPLPLVAPGELSGGEGAVGGIWPVRVTVRRDAAGGEVLSSTVVNVGLGQAGPQFRVIAPEEPGGGGAVAGGGAGGGTGGGAIPPLGHVTGLPVRVAAVREEELLEGPPLLMAACDAVLLPAKAAGRMSQERAAAVLNVGARLMVSGGTAPGGTLARLVWDPLTDDHAAERGWISPPEALPSPAVIEPGLAGPRVMARMETGLPVTIRGALLGVGPAALLLLVLARGIFRRRPLVFAATTVAMAGLTVGMIAWLKNENVPERREVEWSSMIGSSHAVGGLTITEKVTVAEPVFAYSASTGSEAGGGGGDDAGGGAVVLPVAGSARRYFEMRDVELVLGSGMGPREEGDRLEARVRGRQRFVWLERRTRISGLMPPLPGNEEERRHFREITGIDLSEGSWLEGGYVHEAGRGEAAGMPAGGEGTVFAQWAQLHPELRESALAWYEARFEAGRRYYLRPAEDPRKFAVIDFGEVPASQP